MYVTRSLRPSTRRPRVIWPWIRLTLALLLLLMALPAVIQATTYLTFYLTVGATEYGHGFALAALALALSGLWRRRRTAQGQPGGRAVRLGRWAGRLATLLALAAVLLFSTAAVRALPIATALPGQLTAAFGPLAGPGVGAAAPYAPRRLFTGVPHPTIAPETRTYATPDGQPLRLDIYRPQAAAPAPAVILIHGGSWRAGDRTEQPALNSYLAAQGYAVFAIEYRLAPKEHPPISAPFFPLAKADVAAAIAYVKEHAAEFGADPSRLVLLGRSAGGQLALVAGYTAGDPAIRGVVDFYGPVDLDWGWDFPGTVLDSRNILSGYLGGPPTTTRAVWDAAEADKLVGPGTPPTLIIHGAQDTMVGLRHSLVLDAALTRAGRPHLLVQLPWATHGCDFNFSGPCGQLSTYAVEHFLTAVTR